MSDAKTEPGGTGGIDATERFERALELGVPELYFNGFVNGVGQGDVWSVIERNGQPEAVLNMSYTVAKSFALSLGKLIALLEERAEREMLTTNDIEAIFNQDAEQKK